MDSEAEDEELEFLCRAFVETGTIGGLEEEADFESLCRNFVESGDLKKMTGEGPSLSFWDYKNAEGTKHAEQQLSVRYPATPTQNKQTHQSELKQFYHGDVFGNTPTTAALNSSSPRTKDKFTQLDPMLRAFHEQNQKFLYEAAKGKASFDASGIVNQGKTYLLHPLLCIGNKTTEVHPSFRKRRLAPIDQDNWSESTSDVQSHPENEDRGRDSHGNTNQATTSTSSGSELESYKSSEKLQTIGLSSNSRVNCDTSSRMRHRQQNEQSHILKQSGRGPSVDQIDEEDNNDTELGQCSKYNNCGKKRLTNMEKRLKKEQRYLKKYIRRLQQEKETYIEMWKQEYEIIHSQKRQSGNCCNMIQICSWGRELLISHSTSYFKSLSKVVSTLRGAIKNIPLLTATRSYIYNASPKISSQKDDEVSTEVSDGVEDRIDDMKDILQPRKSQFINNYNNETEVANGINLHKKGNQHHRLNIMVDDVLV